MLTRFGLAPPAATRAATKSNVPETKVFDLLGIGAFMALMTVGAALWSGPSDEDRQREIEAERQEYIDEAARLQADHEAALASGDDSRAEDIKREFDELMADAQDWARQNA